jgi:hypothetical protein
MNFILYLASINGYKDIAELLVKNNADLNLKNHFGLTALFEGCFLIIKKYN